MSTSEWLARQAERRGPTWALVLLGVLVGGWRLLRWLAVHLVVAGVLALLALSWWAIDRGLWLWLMGATGVILLALGGWAEARPDGWARLGKAVRARWRRRGYARRWDDAMDGAGLVRAGMVPALQSVRLGGGPAERDLDVLRVAMATGQLVSDWRAVQPRLVSAFGDLGIRRVRCHAVPGRPDLVELFAGRRPLVQPRIAKPANTAVTEPSEGKDQPVAGTVQDDAGRQPRGAFPRTPGGAR